MPKQIPFPTRLRRDTPEETKDIPIIPNELKLPGETPAETPPAETQPEESKLVEETPEATPEIETTPDVTPAKTELPSGMKMENVVFIEGVPVEIKPTKLKYFRNEAVSAYGFIKAIPLTTFLTYKKGAFKEDRDADEMLFDFLVGVFDSSEFVRDHYDEMTADDVDQIVKIFGRLNHINEKEEQARKNQQAQGNR